jgi:hypothetical protein
MFSELQGYIVNESYTPPRFSAAKLLLKQATGGLQTARCNISEDEIILMVIGHLEAP